MTNSFKHNFLRKFLLGLGVFFGGLLLIIGGVGIYLFSHQDEIAEKLVNSLKDQIKKSAGVDFSVRSIHLNLMHQLRLSDIEATAPIQNAGTVNLKIHQLELHYNLWQLLHRQLIVSAVDIENLAILTTIDLQKIAQTPKAETKSDPKAFAKVIEKPPVTIDLDHFNIDHLTVDAAILDKEKKISLQIADLNIQSQIHLQPHILKIAGVLNSKQNTTINFIDKLKAIQLALKFVQNVDLKATINEKDQELSYQTFVEHSFSLKDFDLQATKLKLQTKIKAMELSQKLELDSAADVLAKSHLEAKLQEITEAKFLTRALNVNLNNDLTISHDLKQVDTKAHLLLDGKNPLDVSLAIIDRDKHFKGTIDLRDVVQSSFLEVFKSTSHLKRLFKENSLNFLAGLEYDHASDHVWQDIPEDPVKWFLSESSLRFYLKSTNSSDGLWHESLKKPVAVQLENKINFDGSNKQLDFGAQAQIDKRVIANITAKTSAPKIAAFQAKTFTTPLEILVQAQIDPVTLENLKKVPAGEKPGLIKLVSKASGQIHWSANQLQKANATWTLAVDPVDFPPVRTGTMLLDLKKLLGAITANGSVEFVPGKTASAKTFISLNDKLFAVLFKVTADLGRTQKMSLIADARISWPESLAGYQGITSSGSIELPLTVLVDDMKKISVNGNVKFNQFSFKNAQIDMQNARGQVPFSEELVRTGPKSISFVYLLQRNPFERANFAKQHPLIFSNPELTIKSISLANNKVGPLHFTGNITQNMLIASRFYLALLGGQSAGSYYVNLLPDDFEIGFLTRFTQINPSLLQPLKSSPKSPAVEVSPELINGRAFFVYDPLKYLVKGRFDLTKIGSPQIISLINALDPKYEDPNLVNARSSLALAQPRSLNLTMDQGYMNMLFEFTALGVTPRIDIRKIPLTSFVQAATSEFVPKLKEINLK